MAATNRLRLHPLRLRLFRQRKAAMLFPGLLLLFALLPVIASGVLFSETPMALKLLVKERFGQSTEIRKML